MEAIRRDRDSDVVRLVYADWLEERGDLRADILRLPLELAELWTALLQEKNPYRSRYIERIARTQLRLRELRQRTSAEWLAKIHCGKVDICGFRSGKCPSQWENLADTDDPLIRRCEVCQDNVRFRANGERHMIDERAVYSLYP